MLYTSLQSSFPLPPNVTNATTVTNANGQPALSKQKGRKKSKNNNADLTSSTTTTRNSIHNAADNVEVTVIECPRVNDVLFLRGGKFWNDNNKFQRGNLEFMDIIGSKITSYQDTRSWKKKHEVLMTALHDFLTLTKGKGRFLTNATAQLQNMVHHDTTPPDGCWIELPLSSPLLMQKVRNLLINHIRRLEKASILLPSSLSLSRKNKNKNRGGVKRAAGGAEKKVVIKKRKIVVATTPKKIVVVATLPNKKKKMVAIPKKKMVPTTTTKTRMNKALTTTTKKTTPMMTKLPLLSSVMKLPLSLSRPLPLPPPPPPQPQPRVSTTTTTTKGKRTLVSIFDNDIIDNDNNINIDSDVDNIQHNGGGGKNTNNNDISNHNGGDTNNGENSTRLHQVVNAIVAIDDSLNREVDELFLNSFGDQDNQLIGGQSSCYDIGMGDVHVGDDDGDGDGDGASLAGNLEDDFPILSIDANINNCQHNEEVGFAELVGQGSSHEEINGITDTLLECLF